MGVSKNRGIPKWMVYSGKPYFLMDDLGGKPTILGNIQMELREEVWYLKCQVLPEGGPKVEKSCGPEVMFFLKLTPYVCSASFVDVDVYIYI